MLIAHLSDLHFGCEHPEVVTAALERLRELKPDVVVLSGDITQRAKPEEYARARAFLAELPAARHLVIPGNHDLPLTNPLARMVSPLGRFRYTFGSEVTPVLDRPEVLIVTLNTTRPWRHKNGQVSPAQIERVRRCLQEGPAGRLRIVVAHHPAAVIRRQDVPDRLRGASDALGAWRQAGCDLVLGGHIHLPYITPWPEETPPLAENSPVWVVQAGTAVSRRVRYEAGNSFNLIRALPPRNTDRWCVVERWDHRPRDGFVLSLSKPLTLGNRPVALQTRAD